MAILRLQKPAGTVVLIPKQYEQKAVIVLLALLSLGIKEIHLGPTLPAFLSPNVTKVLVENFGVSGIGTVESDMRKWGLTNG